MIKELIFFIFIAIFLGLSQTAGVGGGPIVNIGLMISMGYQAKLSISITYIFLIGGSIASVWKNASKKNPQTGKTYVSLDLIQLTLPIMSSGAIFGSIIKNFVSQLIITLLFILLFLFLAYDLRRTIRKIRQAHDNSLIAIKPVSKKKQKKGLIQNIIKSSQQIISQTIDSKVKEVIILCGGYYIFTVVVSLIRGGSNYQSIVGIDSCGFGGWVIIFLHLGVSIYWSYRTAERIISQSSTDRMKNPLMKREVQIDKQNVWSFIAAGFVAGMIGATLAIGGAIILIPVWLKLGVDKDVASSSTASLILISAMVAFTIAMFNGYYENVSSLGMLFYLVLAFVSAAIVKDFLTYLTVKYQLKAIAVQLLLIVVVVSLIVMVPYQFSKMFHDYENFVEFGEFC